MARSKASRAAELQAEKEGASRADVPVELDELEGVVNGGGVSDEDEDGDPDQDEEYRDSEVIGRDDDGDDGAQQEDGDDKPKKKRKRASVSTTGKSRVLNCENCRSRKMKCDRKDPCSNCSIRNIVCQWVVGPPAPRPNEQPEASAHAAEIARLRAEVKSLTTRLQLTPEQVEEISKEADQILKDEKGIEPLRQAKPPVPRHRKSDAASSTPKPPAAKRAKTSADGEESTPGVPTVPQPQQTAAERYKRGFKTTNWSPGWDGSPAPSAPGTGARQSIGGSEPSTSWTDPSGSRVGDDPIQQLFNMGAGTSSIIDEALANLASGSAAFPTVRQDQQQTGFAPPRTAPPSSSISPQLASLGTNDPAKLGQAGNLAANVAFPTSSSRGSGGAPPLPAIPVLPAASVSKNWYETAEGQAAAQQAAQHAAVQHATHQIQMGDIVVDSGLDD